MEHPSMRRVFDHVVGIADAANAWVEYFQQGNPQGCRCLPWESGINEAFIRSLRETDKQFVRQGMGAK